MFCPGCRAACKATTGPGTSDLQCCCCTTVRTRVCYERINCYLDLQLHHVTAYATVLLVAVIQAQPSTSHRMGGSPRGSHQANVCPVLHCFANDQAVRASAGSVCSGAVESAVLLEQQTPAMNAQHCYKHTAEQQQPAPCTVVQPLCHQEESKNLSYQQCRHSHSLRTPSRAAMVALFGCRQQQG